MQVDKSGGSYTCRLCGIETIKGYRYCKDCYEKVKQAYSQVEHKLKTKQEGRT